MMERELPNPASAWGRRLPISWKWVRIQNSQWLRLRGKLRSGEIKSEKTFREVPEHDRHEYDIITPGQRNQQCVNGQHWRSSVHLVPFFGNLGISEITAGKIQEYRIHKMPASNRRTRQATGTQHYALCNSIPDYGPTKHGAWSSGT
jgi:hypothetical protein